MGDARDGSAPNPRKVILTLHVHGGHAPANQQTRALVDSDSGNSHLVNYVDEVLGHREVRRGSGKAAHATIVGTCTASMFDEKVEVDLPFLGDTAASHAMDTCSKYSLLLPVQSENPQEVWGVFCSG